MYGMQHVPKGRNLLRNAIVFKASSDYQILGQSFNWLSFEGVTGVSIIGGALDAKGTALWACKLTGSTDCPNGGATVRNSCFLVDLVKFCLNLLSTLPYQSLRVLLFPKF
ncbi:unnamed protein product [Prunus armeniaca]|uniref:Uncharacterized protein n=1 Tax=Prunus armeniaca TaxID=36596 RepID=A0A6J5XXZ7_PRUAR|nr:unnamed protein product [Prunus armeniaca]